MSAGGPREQAPFSCTEANVSSSSSIPAMDGLPSDISVKTEPKLLGSFKPDDYDRMFCATTSALPPITSNTGGFPARTLSESTNSFDHTINQTPIMPVNESQRPENCVPTDLSDIYGTVDGLDLQNMHNDNGLIYGTVDGLDLQNMHNDNGLVDMNGSLDQNHVDADPASFDAGVEKLETETDDRFLNWLYCENEHAEDDNAEYTRVLEEIERDACYPVKMEGDNQGQDFGMSGCPSSSVTSEAYGKAELDPSHPLSSDCVVGEYASLPPTMPPREPVPEGYVMNDYESDMDLDMLPIGEDEETMYGRLLDVLVRDIKLLAYNNAALVDEVSRLNYAILIASEERKVLARRSCHHDRNRIRRLQTANKRKSDAQKRQQEQLTLAETQENIAQIKAKMAKSIASPQKAKPTTSSSNSRPTLDVAAIKRSVEAEQRALDDRVPSKKSKRKSASSKSQRKRTDAQRTEKSLISATYTWFRDVDEGASKRMRCDPETVKPKEEMLIPSEVGTSQNADKALLLEGAVPISAEEPLAESNRRRRPSRQEVDEQTSSGAVTQEPRSVSSASDQTSEAAVTTPESAAPADEVAGTLAESDKDDESQSWRKRSGRPPARAASAAAQTLLAADRSRSNTNESSSSRVQKQKRSISSSNHPGTLEQAAGDVASHPLSRELAIDVSDVPTSEAEQGKLGDMELDHRDDAAEEEMALSDALGSEDSGSRGSQRLRPIRRSTRTSSRQSFGEAADGVETPGRESRSPSHEEPSNGEEPVSRSTRSHSRSSGSASTPSGERQMRERKQPVLYSPVAKNSPVQQSRSVKRKS
ncbi:hypothetical protein OESDEN_12116 [Oesophagostomum dentatum]|uniref:Uncharacterized protein n=1 Tax=Oesophagostomum dentatum TaxID=61180 RepID=A0A0B1ST25_OESDE|nr:hypothetical protein OESDEN_12116 [Oesophagostomum dentatum]